MVEPIKYTKYTSDYSVKLGWKKKVLISVFEYRITKISKSRNYEINNHGMNWYNSDMETFLIQHQGQCQEAVN